LGLFLYESVSNESATTQRAWWKRHLQIPDLRDFLITESSAAGEQQYSEGEQGKVRREEDRIKRMEAAEKVAAKTGNRTKVNDEDYLKEPELKKINAEDYFMQLKPIVYRNKEDAANIPVSAFMKNNIRLYLPSVFKGLIKDQPAIKSWADPKYFLNKIGSKFVEAHNYLLNENLRPFAGSKIIKEQTGRYVEFKMFWDRFMEKFDDQ
jgi:hypothetical protein